MIKNNVKLEEAIKYINTMYHNKMNNDEEFTDLELASVRLLRERTLNKYEIERLNNILKALEKGIKDNITELEEHQLSRDRIDEDKEILRFLKELKGSDKE